MTNPAELKTLRKQLKAFLKKKPTMSQSVSYAMQMVVCAINTALTNPHAPEFINEWLREARRDFEAASRLARGQRGT